MKKYLIVAKEVFAVSYIVEAKDQDEAIKKWKNDEAEEVDMEYLAQLAEYTKYAKPYIQEII